MLDWDYSPTVVCTQALATVAAPIEYHEAGLAENDQIEAGLGDLVINRHWYGTFFWQHFMDRTVTQSLQKPATNGFYTDQRQYLF